MQKFGLLLLLVFGFVGCSVETPQASAGSQEVFTSRRALSAPPAQRLSVGGDCTAYGSAGCATGLCLHVVGATGALTYVCSNECSADADCKSGWSCAQLHSGAGGWKCVPRNAIDLVRNSATVVSGNSDAGSP